MLRPLFSSSHIVEKLAAVLARRNQGERRRTQVIGGRITNSVAESLEIRSLLSSTSIGDAVQQYQAAVPRVSLESPIGFLSQPSNGDARSIADSYLRANAGRLGLTAADINSLAITNEYVSTGSGTTHIYMQQVVNGLPVVNANLNINISRRGEVINVSSSVVPHVAASTAAPAPTITPVQALASLTNSFGWQFELAQPILLSQGVSISKNSVISAAGVSRKDIPASLRYVPGANGSLELAWLVNVQTTDFMSWYDASISAVDGRLLNVVDWSNAASYKVVTVPNENPVESLPTTVTNPADPTASPFGWHDTDGVAGPEFTDTRGNNVFAQEDKDSNDSDVGSVRPDGGAGLVFDFPYSPTGTVTENQNAAIVNLFYWNNVLHDYLYQYGFTEAAGNFQFNNYGKGGLGGDQVQADALDGSGTNNANFQTPPDGLSGRMQMYEWTFTTPTRDSDFDGFVIAHEYGHGLTNRLTGGPANSGALIAQQSRAMGEGWSDFLGLMITQKVTDRQFDSYSVGNWLLGNSLNDPFGGIRDFPYNFDMTLSPKTYGDFNSSQAPHPNGEIMAATLWDLNWLMINGNGVNIAGQGYDPDLYNGTGGNNKLMGVFVEALKLQGANPSYLDFRDAMIAADLSLNSGNNFAAIWTSFARRGMGFSARDGGSGFSSNITEAFDLPPELLLGLTVSVSSISEDGGTAANIGTVSRPSSANLATPLVVSLVSSNPSKLTVPGQVTILPGATTASFDITAVKNSILDGDISVVITASANSFLTTPTQTVLVTDFEDFDVTFLSSSVSENAGNNAATVRVKRNNTDIQPLNRTVSINNELREYDAAGTLISTIPIPWRSAVRPAGEDARDVIVLQDGRVAVYNGTNSPSLSIYNKLTATWTHITVSGLSATAADGGAGGIASFDKYVFLTDIQSGNGNPQGLVRIDTVNGQVTRFSTTTSYRDVATSPNGSVYGLSTDGTTVNVFNALSLNSTDTRSLKFAVRAISIDTAGVIYGAGAGGTIRSFSSDGSQLISATPISADFNDIEVNVLGRILLSSTAGDIVATDTSLTGFSVTASSVDDAFVSFGEHPFVSTRELQVTVTIQDLSELKFSSGNPAQITVIIPAGQAFIDVPFSAVPDDLLDGTQSVALVAAATGYISSTGRIDVLDGESLVVDVLNSPVSEVAGTITNGIRLTRTDFEGPYTYSLEQQFPDTIDDETGLTILDRDTVISTIQIPQQFSRVTDVNVTLSLTHQELADLDVFLVSPDGIRVELFTDLVTNGVEMNSTTLDANAFEPINGAVAPFSGSFRAEGRLEDFEGINPSGTWTLEITDDNRLDTGILHSWDLTITTLGLAPLDVTLSSSDTTEATVPSTVQIPANQTEVIVALTAETDSLLDGTQTATITAEAPAGFGLLSGSDTVNVTDFQELVFNVSGRTMSEAAGAAGLTGTVSRTNTNVSLPLTVSLFSNDPSEATVPATVVIPAGRTFALFPITAVNDTIEDGTQTVTISVSAVGYAGTPSQDIEVTDFEAQLQLSAAATTVAENAGSFVITVRRINVDDFSQPLVVSLASDQPGQIQVPLSVTIPAGRFSETFTASVINDNVLETLQNITISATSPDVPFGGELVIRLTDHEPLSLTITPGFVYEAEIVKGDGKNVVTGTVTRNNSDVSQPLVVTLSSADVREITVPATVTIPAGENSATFSVTGVNDNIVQPIGATLFVNVTASATGFINGVKSVQILDHEPPVVTSPAVKSTRDVPLVQVAEARPVIRWQALQGAIRYDVVIRSLTLGATVVQRNGITTTSFTPTEDLGIGRYSVQVRAYDALERPGFWSEPRDFIVRTPPALTVPSPSNGFAATTTFPTISWTAVRDAIRYDVWVDNLTTGQEQVIRQPFLRTTSFTPTQVMPPGRYRIWVRAINEKNDVGFWSSRTILLVQAPPVVTSPKGGSFDRTPTYTWTSVAIVDHYELWVSDIRTRNIPLVRDVLIKGTTKFSTEELAPGEYLAWVRSFSGSVASAWSVPSRFRVSLPPVFTELAGENPAGDGATFSWSSVDDTERYELFVYSLGGSPERQVKNLVTQTNLTGTSFTHTTALAPGRYRAWIRSISVMGEVTAWNSQIFEVAHHRGVPVPENSEFDIATLQNTVIPVSLARDGVVRDGAFISTPDSSHEVSVTVAERTRSAAAQSQRTDLMESGNSDLTMTADQAGVAEDTAACDLVMSDWTAAEWWAGTPAPVVQPLTEVTDRTQRSGKQNRIPVVDNPTAVQ